MGQVHGRTTKGLMFDGKLISALIQRALAICQHNIRLEVRGESWVMKPYDPRNTFPGTDPRSFKDSSITIHLVLTVANEIHTLEIFQCDISVSRLPILETFPFFLYWNQFFC